LTGANKSRPGRRARPGTYLVFLGLFGLALLATHAGMLRLPFHWDELGQFVPQALDLYRDGAWVPHSAAPNVHPPGVMAYLAGVWLVFGYGVEVTRLAMLAVASLAMLAAFLLAIELSRNAPGAPAFAAALLLFLSPVFFAQAVMVHLDMPAMLFTSLALLWFLQERLKLAMLAAIALVLTKETGLIVPLVFAAWLAGERRYRTAALFLVPAVPLAAWLAALASSTGHLFGDAAFTEYNLFYPLHPARLAMALVRRLDYLFIAGFHFVGTAALVFAWRRTTLFGSRSWKIAWLLVAAHAVLLSMLGGAVLERYLLPVLPVLYAGMAAAMMFLGKRLRTAAIAVLAVGLLGGGFWGRWPPENSLGWTAYVRLHREAAVFLETNYADTRIATAWPFSAALRRPGLGYVDTRLQVTELPDFLPGALAAIDWDRSPVLVLFLRNPDAPSALYRTVVVRSLRERYLDWAPDITPAELRERLPLELVARWSRRGYWVEVYAKRGRLPAPVPLSKF
jgi:hypothetical protein